MSSTALVAAGLSLEAELLLEVAGVGPGRQAAVARILAQRLDWERVLRAAEDNRVVGLLCRALEREGFRGVPPDVRETVRACFAPIRFRSLSMAREMLELVALLEGEGIPVLPYKGPVLAATLYDDLADRQQADLDLLVPRDAFDRAKTRILARGYRLRILEVAALPDDCEVGLVRDDLDLLVELHWDILPTRFRDGFEVDALWRRAGTVAIGGRTIRALGPEDLLLLLCIHGGEKHRWMRLQMLADVARLLAKHRELDWGTLFARSSSIGRDATVLLGVLLAWLMLDAPLPPEIVQRAVADPALLAQAGMVRGRMFSTGLPSYRVWRQYVQRAVESSSSKGESVTATLGRGRYLATVLTPDWNDRRALRLPPALSLLYYVYRPLRLLRRHGPALLRRV